MAFFTATLPTLGEQQGKCDLINHTPSSMCDSPFSPDANRAKLSVLSFGYVDPVATPVICSK